MIPLTYKLRSGALVLAKMYEGEARPMTFANRTQAEEAALRFGGDVHKPPMSRPWYVRLDLSAEYLAEAAETIERAAQ